jgi:hypothetical protein
MPNKHEDPYERIKQNCEACGREFMPGEIFAYCLETDEKQSHDLCEACSDEFKEDEGFTEVPDMLPEPEFRLLEAWIAESAQHPNTSLDLSTQIELLREQLGGLISQLENIHQDEGNPDGYWVAGNIDLEGARTAMNRTGGAL